MNAFNTFKIMAGLYAWCLVLLSISMIAAVRAQQVAIEKCSPDKLKDVMSDLPSDRITINPSGDPSRLYRGQGGASFPKTDNTFIEMDLTGRSYQLVQIAVDGNFQTLSAKTKTADGTWTTPAAQSNEWYAQMDFLGSGQRADYLRIYPGNIYDPDENSYRGTLRVMVCEK